MDDVLPLPPYLTKWTGFVLGRVSAHSDRLFRDALRPFAIHEPHFGILLLLEHRGPQVQAHLSAPLRIDKATMVGLVNDLEQLGYVRRAPNPRDRRAVLVQITDPGLTLVAEINDLAAQIEAQVYAALSPAERQTLHELLVRVAEHTPTPPPT
jgi:DNA-binding MarR family transcriptional regulator